MQFVLNLDSKVSLLELSAMGFIKVYDFVFYFRIREITLKLLKVNVDLILNKCRAETAIHLYTLEVCLDYLLQKVLGFKM